MKKKTFIKFLKARKVTLSVGLMAVLLCIFIVALTVPVEVQRHLFFNAHFIGGSLILLSGILFTNFLSYYHEKHRSGHRLDTDFDSMDSEPSTY